MAHGLLDAGTGVLSILCEGGNVVYADLLVGGGIRWAPEGGAVVFRSLPHFVRAMTVRRRILATISRRISAFHPQPHLSISTPCLSRLDPPRPPE